MSSKTLPNPMTLWWIGYWMAIVEETAEGSSWNLLKHALGALSDAVVFKGIDFVGQRAKKIIDDYNQLYPTGDEEVSQRQSVVFKNNCRYLHGRLEETLKNWILNCPETSMNVNQLLQGISAFLTREELAILSTIERKSLDEATSCILSNNFTSAEFISLRAVESLLRRWYEKKTGTVIEDGNWGEVINKLDKEFPEGKRPREISYLYFLKERRNAVAHPEVISSENDALMTFCQVLEALKRLQKHLIDGD